MDFSSIERRVFMKKWYQRRSIWIFAAIVVIVILASSVVSYVKFNVINPFSSGLGMVRILTTDTEYVEIQHNPRVIIAKPDGTVFVSMLEKEGFTEIENEQLGALHVIEKAGVKEKVFFSINKYYSSYIWD